ncbi:hypothetical protein [Cryptosporangium sp. NPDC048952]|uniref:hypothetical protein n=1 Tax=Cryptosporangium sp. NPDC048952 TaxID=3363961 RepID=UPI003715A1BD
MTDIDPRRPPIARLWPGGRGLPSRRLRRTLLTGTGNRRSGSGNDTGGGDRQAREWHELDTAERLEAWAELVDWVVWLHDRYELSVEERLPPCWPQHPGLVEELAALKLWRTDIYSADGGGQAIGQAARYWHGELRQMLTTAVTVYAAGCRAAHRGAQPLDTVDARLRDRWLAADPLVGIPLHRTTARRSAAVTGGGAVMPDRDMQRALTAHHAAPLGATVPDIAHYRGTWWIAAGGEDVWHAVTDSTAAADLDRAAARLAIADDAVRRRNAAFVLDPGRRRADVVPDTPR